MNHQVRCAFSALFVAASVSVAEPAHADVTTWGNVSPQNPSDPWDLGLSRLVVKSGTVEVTNGGTLISSGASVDGGSADFGTVQVDGYGSTWINNGSIELGRNYTEGWVIIRNGAEVITDDLVAGFSGSQGYGRVLVEGYDATLTSRTNTYIGDRGQGHVELKQGASFFSHNVYVGGAHGCSICGGEIAITGSATTWVSTGEFVLGVKSRGLLNIQRGQLFTVGARIDGDDFMNSHASVSGWGGTWTNQGLMRVGANRGYGTISVGAYGTLVTEDTEIRSELGGGFVKADDVYASWLNSGDVTIFAIGNQSPSLLVGKGALVSIGGLLRTVPMVSTYPYLGPSVRLADGDLIAGAMAVAEGDFGFAGGRLEIGSFEGDLANMQAGELSVGEVYPSTGVAGSYSQGPGAALSITVAGSSALPLLQVDGDVHLDGALEVRPTDGSVSFEAGDAIVLLGWSGDLTGTFAAVNIALPLAPGLAWDTSALYTTGEITVVTAT
jgi:T5SS/PEP-CTERM-associated repeat protein